VTSTLMLGGSLSSITGANWVGFLPKNWLNSFGVKNLSSLEKMQLNGTSFGFPLKLLHSVRWLMW